MDMRSRKKPTTGRVRTDLLSNASMFDENDTGVGGVAVAARAAADGRASGGTENSRVTRAIGRPLAISTARATYLPGASSDTGIVACAMRLPGLLLAIVIGSV